MIGYFKGVWISSNIDRLHFQTVHECHFSPQPFSSLLSSQSFCPLQTLLASIHWPELHMYCWGAQVGWGETHKLSASSEPSMQSLSPSQVKEPEIQAPLAQVNWLLLQVSYVQPNSSLPSPQSFTRSQLRKEGTLKKGVISKVDQRILVHTWFQLTGKGAGCKAH